MSWQKETDDMNEANQNSIVFLKRLAILSLGYMYSMCIELMAVLLHCFIYLVTFRLYSPRDSGMENGCLQKYEKRWLTKTLA